MLMCHSLKIRTMDEANRLPPTWLKCNSFCNMDRPTYWLTRCLDNKTRLPYEENGSSSQDLEHNLAMACLQSTHCCLCNWWWRMEILEFNTIQYDSILNFCLSIIKSFVPLDALAHAHVCSHPGSPTASSSSMKMTHGVAFRASANSSRIRAAPRPTNSSTNSLALTARNGMPASPATALAVMKPQIRVE